MEGVAGATSKELRVSDGRETVSAPGNRERSERNKGAPVATNKERRPSEKRERRGRETVSAPG